MTDGGRWAKRDITNARDRKHAVTTATAYRRCAHADVLVTARVCCTFGDTAGWDTRRFRAFPTLCDLPT